MSTRKTAALGALFGLPLLLLASAASAAPVAGEVNMLTGRGTATSPDGSVRNLAKGGQVFSGDVVSSGMFSYVNIKFTDGGYTLLRPNTRFKIEDYALGAALEVPQPETGAPKPQAPAGTAIQPAPAQKSVGGSRAFFRLVRGGLRSVTGLIGKGNPAQFRVNTPTATIGIRGTDITVVDCDLACQTDPVIHDAIAGLPPGTTALGATILIVNSGEAFITDTLSGKTTSAGPGTVVLSLADGTQIVLSQQPTFIQDDPPPDPATCGN